MKKITTIVLLFVLSWQTNGQNLDISDVKRLELKLDVGYLIFAPALKVECEYFLSEWSSFGGAGLFLFDSDELEKQLLGFYRLYFGKDPMSGFFLEGNFGISSGSYEHYRNYELKNYMAFGVGIALGWKWYIPKSGIVLDVFAGGGRLLGDNAPWGYPRLGICVGKRF
jgi:hypothetical protein